MAVHAQWLPPDTTRLKSRAMGAVQDLTLVRRNFAGIKKTISDNELNLAELTDNPDDAMTKAQLQQVMDFYAALELLFENGSVPSGYWGPILAKITKVMES